MLNHGIIRLVIGKTQAEAISHLETFNCKWRVYAIDGAVLDAAPDRDDKRYNLIVENGRIVRVIAG